MVTIFIWERGRKWVRVCARERGSCACICVRVCPYKIMQSSERGHNVTPLNWQCTDWVVHEGTRPLKPCALLNHVYRNAHILLHKLTSPQPQIHLPLPRLLAHYSLSLARALNFNVPLNRIDSWGLCPYVCKHRKMLIKYSTETYS